MAQNLEKEIENVNDFLCDHAESQKVLLDWKKIYDFLTKKNKKQLTEAKALPRPTISRYEMAIYTDGACRGNPGPGSWCGIAQNYHGDRIFQVSSFSEHTTNNKMEMSAVIGCLEELLEARRNQQSSEDFTSISLFTDSKYVKDGIESWMPGWKKRGWKKSDGKVPENIDLWQKIDTLLIQLSVPLKIHWIKGHSGHPQNEHCDRVCNEILDRELFS